MTHWSDQYLGRPWIAESYNCADLAIEVQRDVFGRIAKIEGAHSGDMDVLDQAIRAELESAAILTYAPKDGDGVLLSNGSMLHVGIYCNMQEPWVLHNVAKAGVVRHRLRDLHRYGFTVEGYYQWR